MLQLFSTSLQRHAERKWNIVKGDCPERNATQSKHLTASEPMLCETLRLRYPAARESCAQGDALVCVGMGGMYIRRRS
jgi:hypothetical protein